MKKERIVLPGGRGLVGRYLARRFADEGFEVIVLSRVGNRDPVCGVRHVYWNGRCGGEWCKWLEGATAVINLAGKSVDCRYDAMAKWEILMSRLDSTQAIGNAIARTKNKPKVWMNAASATIYVDTRGETNANTEARGKVGDDFSMTVCREWEKTFNRCTTPGTRKVLLRMAIVLGRGGGAFEPLCRLAKTGLGGRHGSGDQYMSWIHIEDLFRAVRFLIDEDEAEGVFNCASPNPTPNDRFMAKVRRAVGVKWGMPMPAWLLEVGAMIIRTETELLLKSRKVFPERLLNAGFRFEYGKVETALNELTMERRN